MYAAVNLGAFAVAALVARTRPANRITDYRGLYHQRPVVALALGFFLLCLAGLPPGIIGLFAKVTVFSVAVDAGLAWLAVIMAFNVVIALYYYLQWTTVLFRGAEEATGGADGAKAPEAAQTRQPSHARIPAPLATAIALATVLGIALSGAPQLVLRFASGALL